MKTINEMILEMNKTYSNTNELIRAIDNFDKLKDSKKPNEAYNIIKSAKELNYNLMKKEILKYNNYRIDYTNHSIGRFIERNPEFNSQHIFKMIKSANNKVNSSGDKLIFSKSNNFGVVVNFKYKLGSNKYKIITVLPKGKKNAKENTELIIIESFENYYSESFTNYINSIINKENISLNENLDYDNVQLVLYENVKYDAVFVNGKLYELCDIEVIEVE